MSKKDKIALKQSPKRIFKTQHWKKKGYLLVCYDIFAVIISYFLALWLRTDCRFSELISDTNNMYLKAYAVSILVYAILVIVVFSCMHLYRSIWRFASFNELLRIVFATAITLVINIVLTAIVIPLIPPVVDFIGESYSRMPISYYVFGIVTQFCLTLGIRFSYRAILFLRGSRNPQGPKNSTNVMLIGAGEAGRMILQDIKSAKDSDLVVKCIIDDNPNKWGRFINDISVVGGTNDILKNVEKYHIQKIYIAIPSATPEQKRDILNVCKETGCELMNLPSIYQLVSGQVTVSSMKKVAVEDLLGRDTIKVNMDEIFNYISGKVILVTGGGGSIGAELCRQIAGHNPKQLIVFDIYENNAYEIQQELKKKYPYLNLTVRIGSVRDFRCVTRIFEEYKPDIVYHAAAHKHVPLMEDSPCESIKNNAIGTYKTAYAAMIYGCKRFVLISTDKAVNPTNIMGASKRLCEMVIQSFDRMCKDGTPEKLPVLYTHNDTDMSDLDKSIMPKNPSTDFVAVRFGNVLGSNGSVIPLFKKQIETGGPVTVTHPDIIRYFMTIPEAVSLVMQAGIYANGGEIFVLDMGDPVKIDTLARNLIKLSGYKPDVDIKIEYTGLRPGEKLYEEKLMAEEGMKTTPNKLIHVGCPIQFDTNEFLKQFQDLMKAAYENDENIRDKVKEIVTTYYPS